MIYIPADNPLTVAGVELGRKLFYETALSGNNQLSCASCHKQELAFTDGKQFSTGVDGSSTKRNSMALVNLLWTDNFFWDGRAKGLEQQVKFPLEDQHEMGQSLNILSRKLSEIRSYPGLFRKAFGTATISGELIAKALAQFERTLISSNSPYDQYLAGKYSPDSSQLRGMKLFFINPQPEKGIRGGACGHCHSGVKTTSQLYHNTGLDTIFTDGGRADVTGQTTDKGRFRVATLRNITLTSPYMHDGRFKSLNEVLDHYSDHIDEQPKLSPFLKDLSNQKNTKGLRLTLQEKEDIIQFLQMLTDSTFIKDPRFSNPSLISQ
ncbi:cytochrome-c peroxidase [Terrimonas sp. NA20]|uniref:Cytochrome-c peroxidase n=1 Tax=Terrimonas ginsenosidimutans TaxID=2908004 RepID=A0ABS9KP35_9BACT|nr:cytochrome c peroxidase [Terrimonas ginsenosidimutans]MCG2614088.1 cytochrome-c peroxidase [Terrimonas ginsenosidimutans]